MENLESSQIKPSRSWVVFLFFLSWVFSFYGISWILGCPEPQDRHNMKCLKASPSILNMTCSLESIALLS